MLLDVSRALRLPGEVFPFLHREEIPPQEIFGETITFSDAVLTGHFSMAGDSLHLEGTLTVTAHGHCAGCLKPVDDPMEIPFDEIFIRQESRHPQAENADQDEDERLVFEGSKVELSQLALTLAVLELPMRFVCGEDCQALAAMQPDIQPTHACQKDMPDQHPFSALQQLLTKDQEV
ncbi:MAG: DUF177 domain-containing protein [Eubacteriales bacterium]|nr:DUF177 domain-containing protein [Eubacteriales bacterium]